MICEKQIRDHEHSLQHRTAVATSLLMEDEEEDDCAFNDIFDCDYPSNVQDDTTIHSAESELHDATPQVWTAYPSKKEDIYAYLKDRCSPPVYFDQLFPPQTKKKSKKVITTNMHFHETEFLVPTAGLARIVVRAVRQQVVESTQTVTAVNILWALLYCWSSLTMSLRMNECVSILNSLAFLRLRLHLAQQAHAGIRIPVNKSEMICTYRKGVHSVIENVPRNRQETIGDHVYMPLDHYVGELFASTLR